MTSVEEDLSITSDPSEVIPDTESVNIDKSEHENNSSNDFEIPEKISEYHQKDTTTLTTDPEEEISIIEPYTEIYVNPLYEDILQPSDLVQPDDMAVTAYSNEEYLSTPEAAGTQLRASIIQRQKTIVIFYQISADQNVPVHDIVDYSLIHTGKPAEGDYLRWNMAGYAIQVTGYKKDNIQYLTLQYTLTYHTTATQEAELTMDIQQIINQLSLSSKNDYEKIRTIYDYICQNVSYDYANLDDSTYMLKYTAYAALKHHTAVCQGYALLFYRLALEAGIDSRIISGISSNENHGWNIVRLDHVYYNIDSTWDAPRKQAGQDYVYFLKCDGNFFNHTRDLQYSNDSFYRSYPMGTSDYSLLKTDISSSTIFLSNNSYIYDGTEKKPLITIRYGNKTLVENSDYQIFYQNNLNVGKASVTVTGIGPYTGTLTVFFDIIRPVDPQPVLQGWKLANGSWYYYRGGVKQTGWQKITQKWYYMDEYGIMKTGWLKLGSTWYYLKPDGAMATGWLRLGSTWYYLNPNGDMATGWLRLGSIWYYLNPNGDMAISDTRINGTVNRFNSSGAWLGIRH